jgi:hypothetical protein
MTHGSNKKVVQEVTYALVKNLTHLVWRGSHRRLADYQQQRGSGHNAHP